MKKQEEERKEVLIAEQTTEKWRVRVYAPERTPEEEEEFKQTVKSAAEEFLKKIVFGMGIDVEARREKK